MVTDGELTGFALRVSASGVKTFLFQYRFGGRVRRLRLGVYGDLTPAQARRLAETARGRVAAGEDPVSDRKRLHAAAEETHRAQKVLSAADSLTLSVLVQRWQDGALRDRSPAYRREATRCLRSSLAPLLAEPAGRLEPGRLQAELDRIAPDHPTTARRVLAYGRAMFGWALKRRLVPANPFAQVVAEGRERSRDRVLTDVELGEAWRAAAALSPPFGPYLQLLILTLQRRTELAGMRWDELAPDLATWTVPAARAKNRKAHVVHLAPAARAIVRGIPRISDMRSGAPSPLVFTTTGRTPISGFQNAKEQLDGLVIIERRKRPAQPTPAMAGEPSAGPALGWRLHDLRGTGVTALARLGVPPHVADRLLNHVQGSIRGVAAVYQRHEFMAEREAALLRWADHVAAVAVGTAPPDSVVMLDAVRRKRAPAGVSKTRG